MHPASNLTWLEIVHPSVRLGRARHALFDFDGTLSVIRHGWEKVMTALMLEMICDGRPPDPAIEQEVARYIDQSTGILTIKQMQWLAAAVRRYGLRPPRTALEYKQMYNERLLAPVRERLARLDGSEAARDSLMIAGARSLLRELAARDVRLYLASGTDLVYVKQEADTLDIARFFGEHIYGAAGDIEDDSKELVIRRILAQHDLQGEQLLVVGDGPFEIRAARSVGAVALGLAADEVKRAGLDERKRRRLLDAGADLLVTDFAHAGELAALLCEG